MTYSPVTHVLFDMDGLLLNTEKFYAIGFQNVCGKYGKEYTYDVIHQIRGLQTNEYADKIIEILQLPISREQFLSECSEQFTELFKETELMPGAKRLVEHLHSKKIPIGLATSSSKQSYELKTVRHLSFFEMFDHITLGSSDPEVKKGKPHPDIFLVSASKFDDRPKPEKCLVFEDAVNGVRAARAAGMQVVMVPDKGLSPEFKAEATQVLDSLEEFQPELFGLPAYEYTWIGGDVTIWRGPSPNSILIA